MKAFLTLAWLAGVAGGWLGCGSVWQTRTFPAPSLNPAPLAAPIVDQRRTVLVSPPTDAYRSQRVGVLLFRPPPHLPEVSQPLTQLFYQHLLASRPFREVVLIPRAYGSVAEAQAIGRQESVDLLLLGEAPYFLDGGTLGTTALQVDLRVVEVKSGHLLWYLSDALRATPRPVIDLIVTETRPEPTPEAYALAGVLARGMCQTLAAGRLASR